MSEALIVGPAAWAAVGRALALALATSLFKGEGSVVVLVARQLEHAISVRDLELANALLRDLAFRHRDAFDDFMVKYASSLPDDAREELQSL